MKKGDPTTSEEPGAFPESNHRSEWEQERKWEKSCVVMLSPTEPAAAHCSSIFCLSPSQLMTFGFIPWLWWPVYPVSVSLSPVKHWGIQQEIAADSLYTNNNNKRICDCKFKKRLNFIFKKQLTLSQDQTQWQCVVDVNTSLILISTLDTDSTETGDLFLTQYTHRLTMMCPRYNS